MDETSYYVSDDNQLVCVKFDVRDQENCIIELSFTKGDILNILNMPALRKEKIDISGIEGVATLNPKRDANRQIVFSYRNGSVVESGTVFYSYEKLTVLLEKAFADINSR